MPDDKIKYSEAYQTARATQLHTTDILGIAQVDPDTETGYGSKGTDFDDMSKFFLKGIQFSSDLQTTNKTVIGAINEVNGKAKENLSDLTDTDITTPSNADLLAYDSSTSKWVNTDLKGQASGSIATFSNGGDGIPVSEFECEIVAQQARGTPTPSSPLPITGHSESDIAVSSKNLWGNGNVSFTGNTQSVYPFRPLLPNTYTISATVTSTDTDATTCAMIIYYTDGTSSATIQFDRGTRYSKTAIIEKTIERIAFYSSDNYSHGTGDTVTWSDIQIEVSTTMTAYENPNLYTVAFGQTIYGGRLIYANGQWSIEATFGYIDLSTISWNTGTANRSKTTALASLIKIPSSTSELCGAFGEKCFEVPSSSSLNTDGQFAVLNTGELVFYRNVDTPTGLLVYPLATPTIIPITSSTRVKTLSGDNNIFSNTGDVNITYFTDKADNIADLIKAFL